MRHTRDGSPTGKSARVSKHRATCLQVTARSRLPPQPLSSDTCAVQYSASPWGPIVETGTYQSDQQAPTLPYEMHASSMSPQATAYPVQPDMPDECEQANSQLHQSATETARGTSRYRCILLLDRLHVPDSTPAATLACHGAELRVVGPCVDSTALHAQPRAALALHGCSLSLLSGVDAAKGQGTDGRGSAAAVKPPLPEDPLYQGGSRESVLPGSQQTYDVTVAVALPGVSPHAALQLQCCIEGLQPPPLHAMFGIDMAPPRPRPTQRLLQAATSSGAPRTPSGSSSGQLSTGAAVAIICAVAGTRSPLCCSLR